MPKWPKEHIDHYANLPICQYATKGWCVPVSSPPHNCSSESTSQALISQLPPCSPSLTTLHNTVTTRDYAWDLTLMLSRFILSMLCTSKDTVDWIQVLSSCLHKISIIHSWFATYSKVFIESKHVWQINLMILLAMSERSYTVRLQLSVMVFITDN